MIQFTDNTGVAPIVKVMPVLPIVSVADPLQELGDRATQFSKGQDYIAHVTSKVSDTTFLVKVEQSMYQMNLGTSAHVGQNLLLKYIQDTPVQTFALLAQNPAADLTKQSSGVSTNLSPAAQLIDQAFKYVESGQTTYKPEVHPVVTQNPNNPALIAQDLKHAVSNSGLFYESHLSEFVEGTRTLSEIKQEPQNRMNAGITNLIPQQLSVLENQRVSWQGELWLGQEMQWNIALPKDQLSKEALDEASQGSAITSDLTLNLPQLGKVTAKLLLVDGRMRIRLLAVEQQTETLLRANCPNLMQAITKNGQVLDGLLVSSYD